MDISAVIAAAGFSSRMGAFKPLLPFGGRTVVERVIAAFSQGGVSSVIVVGGHRFTELQRVVIAAGARCTCNSDFRKGMFSSFKHGFRTLPQGIDAVFAHPVDMPLITPNLVRRMMEAFQQHPRAIIQPVFNGQTGRPVLIPGELIPAILGAREDGGMRKVLSVYQDRFRYVASDHPGVLWDMDVLEAYHRLKAYLPHLTG